MRPFDNKRFVIAFVIFGVVMFTAIGHADDHNAETMSPEPADSKPVIQVFYKEKQPSMKTLEKVKAFLEEYQGRYDIQYIRITDPENESLIKSLGLPTEHFPFALAIDQKTSARIDGKTIVFAHFPDFMHHIGKHQGNWTLAHLVKVLNDNSLMLADNPTVETKPGG